MSRIPFIFLILASLAMPCLGRGQGIRIVPAKLQIGTSSQLVTYLQPCNSEYLGLFFRPGARRKTLGVALRSSLKPCLGLPSPKTIRIPPRLLKNPSEWQAYRSPQKLGRLTQLRVTPHAAPGALAWLNYRCASPLGILLTPDKSKKKLAISAIGRKSKAKNCPLQVKRISLSWLNSSHELTPAYQKGRSAMAYQLALRPIKRQSLRLGRNGFTELKYLRHCSDAPIGLHFDRRTRRYSMLVARYPRLICAAAQQRPRWAGYQSSVIGKEVIAKSLRRQQSLAATHPAQPILLTSRLQSAGRRLAYQTQQSCYQPGGLVIYEDHSTLKIGITSFRRADYRAKCRQYSGRLRLFSKGYSQSFRQSVEPLQLVRRGHS